MKSIAGWLLSVIFLGIGIAIPSNTSVLGDNEDGVVSISQLPISIAPEIDTNATRTTIIAEDNRVTHQGITFLWGDISWLPKLASEAGWPKNTHERLGQIILRESGGCPNRRGGDKVDKYCNITGVSEWSHRSDSGLLQINGVNYDLSRNKSAPICKEMNICSPDDQWQLLDPMTNLKAGFILYQLVGWGPWDPCQWGPDYAHRCSSKPKKNKP